MRRHITIAVATACVAGAAVTSAGIATAQIPPPPVPPAYGPSATPGELFNARSPSVVGTPAVGRALLCLPGTWKYGYRQWGIDWVETVEPVLSYTWLLDSYPIADTAIAAYAPIAGDAGHVVTCRVDATYDPDTVNAGPVLSAFAIAPGVRVPPPPVPPVVRPTVKPPCAKLKGAAKVRCVRRQRCLKLKGARRKVCLRRLATARRP